MVDVQMADRLADVSRPDWDSLVGDDGFYLSHDWLRYVDTEPHERSRYLLATQGGQLTGALVLNWVDDPATIRYRAGHFADLLGIDGRTLLAGATRGYRTTLLLQQPGAADDPHAHHARGPDADGRGRTLAALLRAALSAAHEDGCAGIVLPFLTTGALVELARVARVRAAFDLPEAEVRGCGQGLNAYVAQIRRRVRTKISADRRRFAEAGWAVRVRSLDECWRDAARLLYELQRKHGHGESELAVYERRMAGQACELSGRSVVFCCEDEDGTRDSRSFTRGGTRSTDGRRALTTTACAAGTSTSVPCYTSRSTMRAGTASRCCTWESARGRPRGTGAPCCGRCGRCSSRQAVPMTTLALIS